MQPHCESLWILFLTVPRIAPSWQVWRWMAARSDETKERYCGAARQTTTTMTARRPPAIQNTTGNAGWLFTCSLRATAALSVWLNFAISMGSWRQRATFTAFRVGDRPTLCHLLQRLFSLPFAPISECVTAAHVFVDIVYKKNKCKAGSVELAMDASMIGAAANISRWWWRKMMDAIHHSDEWRHLTKLELGRLSCPAAERKRSKTNSRLIHPYR